MAETTDIIEKAMVDAGLDEHATDDTVVEVVEDNDADETVDEPAVGDDKGSDKGSGKSAVTTGEPADKAGDKGGKGSDKEPAKQTATDVRSDEDKALDKELLELGIKPPKEGRDNRIPYSRTRKIIANALKKRGDAHALTTKELNAKIEALTERTGYMDTVDQMIVRDPDAYIKSLAQLHPALYGKFVPKEGEPKKDGTVPDLNKDDPKPGPDVKDNDGSFGYSPTGLDALLAWNTRAATREALTIARAEMAKEYGPLKDQYQAGQTQTERATRVRNIVEEQRAIWGDDFTKDEALGDKSEILAAYNAEKAAAKTEKRQPAAFGRIVAKVLKAKLQKDQNQIRQDLIDEQNKTAAERKAASTTAPGSTKAVKTAEDDESGSHTEAVVREAMRAAGLS